MPEHIGEHALGLVSVGQVHDDARPLLGERFIGFRVDSTTALCFLTEIVEGLAHRILVAKVGKLAVKDRVVPVHTDFFFTVGKDAEFPNG